MPKWSDLLARLIPWFATDDRASSQYIDEARSVRREQQELAPFIDAQTAYLVRRGELNGFTTQLRASIAQRAAEE